MSGMFVIRSDGSLVEMTQEDYDSEARLQRLIADYPNLLPGDQIDSSAPRRWLLVRQEVGVPAEQGGAGYWALDHLLLDQDGVPTLVEVKRSTDTRIRREVVGQMLDYAANSVAFLPVQRIRDMFETRCASVGLDPEEQIREVTQADDSENYWSRVKANLESGRIRLLFVADHIPIELRRIVEFLNRYTDPLEVLAVEVRQFTGQDLRTLVPQVFGQTVETQTTKTARGPERQWDEPMYFEALAARPDHPPEAVPRRILDWAREHGLRVWWGKGAITGTFMPILDHRGDWHPTISARTSGRIEIQFGHMARKPPFSDPELRRHLLTRLNQVQGVSISEDGTNRFPSVAFEDIADSTEEFLAVWDWYLDQIRAI